MLAVTLWPLTFLQPSLPPYNILNCLATSLGESWDHWLNRVVNLLNCYPYTFHLHSNPIHSWDLQLVQVAVSLLQPAIGSCRASL